MAQAYDGQVTGEPTSTHEIWGTVCGDSVSEVKEQINKLVGFGAVAIEIRLDLVPKSLQNDLRGAIECDIPLWLAHFGKDGDEADQAYDILHSWLSEDISGIICHSRHPRVEELSELAGKNNKEFVGAYHTQSSPSTTELREELERQKKFDPSFRKIAVRPESNSDVLDILKVIAEKSDEGDVVGAIFGPHRWGRIALANVGSPISFISAEQIQNESGGYDMQFDCEEYDTLASIPNIMPETT